jgi:hypothetical protein
VPDVPETTARSLPPDVGGRLDRFLKRLERLRVEELPMFAATPLARNEYQESVNAAMRAGFDSGRRAILEEIHRDAGAWLDRLFSRHQFYPEWAGTQMGVIAGTAQDRVRLAEALKSGLTALVLWDVLDEAYRDHLLGPWAALVEDEDR